MTLAYVILGVALGLSGDYCFKSDRYLWLRFLLYALSGVPIWLSYRHGTWMEVATYWSVLAVLVSGVMGVTLFHESLSPRQQLAFLMAAAAVILWNSSK